MGKRHLSEGVARRLFLLGGSVQTIDTLAFTGRQQVLTPTESEDLNLHLNSFYVHVRGVLDNLAWALHYSHRILGERDEDDVKTRLQCVLNNRTFRAGLRRVDPNLDGRLAEADPWMDELRDFRDPVAHRIPLYAVPGMTEEGGDDERRYRALWDEVSEMAERRAPVAEMWERVAAAFAVGTFVPVIARAEPNGMRVMPLRQQVEGDYRRLLTITRTVLTSLLP
jgi:hypothetical protein